MKTLCAILLLLFTTSIVFAQETLIPVPWPPDPSTIFAEGVEVVSVEFIDPSVPEPIVDSEFVIDPVKRTISTPAGDNFPWPKDINNVYFYHSPPIILDDKLFLAVPEYDRDASSPLEPRILDLKTGAFDTYNFVFGRELIPTACGNFGLVELSYGWMFYPVREPDQHLCRLDDGRMSAALPEGYTWENYLYQVPESADAVLMAHAQGDDPDIITVFVYDALSDDFDSIGKFKKGQVLQLSEWVWNDTALFKTYDENDTHHFSYIVLDLTEGKVYQTAESSDPNESLRYRWYRSNPPRIEVFYDRSDGLCRKIIYHLLTQTETNYPPDELCDRQIENEDGNSYYRVIDADGKEARLVRFNIITGEQAEIYRGEIEEMMWLSNDERYAMLILDNNGTIDMLPGMYPRDANTSNAHLSLVHLTTGQILFEEKAHPEFNGWAPFIKIILGRWLETYTIGSENNTLIELGNDSIQIISLHGLVGDYLGNGWAILFPYAAYEESLTKVGLYNLTTHETVEVVTGAVYGYTTGILQPLADNKLSVTITASSNGFEIIGQATYTIRVPGVEIPVIP